MTEEKRISMQVRIFGRVQGVGFRAWTEREARALFLRGWVRNRYDGSVEAVFDGPRPVVEKMLRMCRSGPCSARVSNLEIKPTLFNGTDFDTRQTR